MASRNLRSSSARCALAPWLVVSLAVSAAQAAEPTGAAPDPQPAKTEMRCETRQLPREIGPRSYVLDRVTVCRARLQSTAPPPPVVASAPTEALGTAAASTDEGSERRRASWSPERDRLGNAQYDRSVRALAQSFVRREG